MQPSIEQRIREFREASAALRREIGDDPAKARAFLESLKPSVSNPRVPPAQTTAAR